MEREKPVALSTADAKARLRISASRLSPSSWVRRHPYETLGLAAAGGLLFGTLPPLRRVLGKGVWSTLAKLIG